MSVASRWAAWQLRRSGVPAGPLAGTDPGYGTFSPKVELFIDEAWVDITRTSPDQAGVYYRDRITISRGKADETSVAEPQTCAFTLNNRDGRFTPTNPLSPYYGKIGRNTQVRVSVLQDGIRKYRFYGEVSNWPTTWDIGGNDVYVQLMASGPKRRLQQGSAPLKSAVFRDMTNPSRTNIAAYWSMEDPAGSSILAPGLSRVGQTPLKIVGSPDLASFSDWFGSNPLPLMQTGTFRGNVAPYTETGETSIRFFCNVGTAVPATYQELIRWKTTGSAAVWWISLKSTGDLRLICKTLDGSSVLDTGDATFGMNTIGMCTVTLEFTETASGDISWVIDVFPIENNLLASDVLLGFSTSGTISANTFGSVASMVVGDNANLGDVAIGHLSIANDISAYAASGRSLASWNDEGPRDRVRRLCREEQINEIDIGTQGNGAVLSDVTMGSQHPNTLVALLEECEATGLDMLYELRDLLGIGYRTRVSLYNQTPRLRLDYQTNGGIADSLNPAYDDRYSKNDLTVNRADGSSARVVQTDGSMSVSDPPDGMGRYDDSITISAGSDDQLTDQAGWRVHLGTVDEARYPQIKLQLSHPSFTGDVGLTSDALALDLGDRIIIENPPPWLPPDNIDLIVLGYTETFDQFLYEMTLNCVPGSPYLVGFVDDSTYDRIDTAGSLLAADIDETTTTLSVATGLPWVAEDFEDTSLNITITDGGNLPWARSSAASHGGTSSLKSGAITNSQTSDAIVSVPAGAKFLTFWYKVSAEPIFDGIVVLVDGVQHLAQTGDSGGWVQRTLIVDGAQTVTFRYSKDPAGAAGDDAAYIDDLLFFADPLWTTDPAEFPTDIKVGGEQMTVTAVSGTTSPQAVTVTRSVNGVVKSHLAGTDVRLAQPQIVSL